MDLLAEFQSGADTPPLLEAKEPGTALKLPPMYGPPLQALISGGGGATRGGGGAAAIGIGQDWPAAASRPFPPNRGGGGWAAGSSGKGKALAAASAMASAKPTRPQGAGGCCCAHGNLKEGSIVRGEY
mmetsp:Transcript_5335/g.10048  ORF Transcript_5335/g.10048 Transcript_5335/m.10048 type:complete len:128 (-) Transcript_5335:325-708(-)